MGVAVFRPPKWSKPRPLGYGKAVESLGTVAAPLLAGFSLASVIVVTDDSTNFRWPGAAAFALVVAAVMMIGAVQCGFNSRQYLWSGAEVREWWPDMRDDSARETVLREQQALAFHRWDVWATWMRVTYNLGILALLVGLALALPPQHDTEAQANWRWAAAGLAFAACAAEVFWILAGFWSRFRDGPED